MTVDVDCGYILEEELEILNHEVFPRCLWAARTTFMVTACGNHVARGTVGWSLYHFANKVHLPRSNHAAYTGYGVKHSSYFVVAESLLANCGH